MNAARLEGRASPSPVGVEGVRRKGRIRSPTPDPCDNHAATMRLCGLVRLRRGRSPCLAPLHRGWKPLLQGRASSLAHWSHATSFCKPSTIRLGTGFESSVR